MLCRELYLPAVVYFLCVRRIRFIHHSRRVMTAPNLDSRVVASSLVFRFFAFARFSSLPALASRQLSRSHQLIAPHRVAHRVASRRVAIAAVAPMTLKTAFRKHREHAPRTQRTAPAHQHISTMSSPSIVHASPSIDHPRPSRDIQIPPPIAIVSTAQRLSSVRQDRRSSIWKIRGRQILTPSVIGLYDGNSRGARHE